MGNLHVFRRSRSFTPGGQQSTRANIGKNKPLKRTNIRWYSQTPLNENQLKRKREEFWDTAPMFEGRIEIWNALKLVTEFVEKNDYEMAQAILDGADILLPTGSLCDCYDRLGTRYQIPVYVFSEPCNLIRSNLDSSLTGSTNDHNSSASHNKRDTVSNQRSNFSRSLPESGATDGTSSGCLPLNGCYRMRNIMMQSSRTFFSSPHVEPHHHSKLDTNEVEQSVEPCAVVPYQLRIRLSTGEDHTLELPSDQHTIALAKQLLAERTQWPPNSQRWFICGRPLSSGARICDCEIPEDFLVQVFVYLPPKSSPTINSGKITDVEESHIQPVDVASSLIVDSV